MRYDVAAVRALFPALAGGTAHFDGPGGSQTPAPVAEAVARIMTSSIANRGTVTAAERLADDVVRETRGAMGDLTGGPSPSEVHRLYHVPASNTAVGQLILEEAG